MSELSRIVPVERLPEALTVEADAAECAGVAARLRIPGVESLRCRFVLRRKGARVEASGTLRAAVVQSCVVTLDPVPQAVSEDFTVFFVPAGTESEDDDMEGPDEIPYENDRIDFGDAVAEQLALALDPYPRSDSAVLGEEAASEEPNPFAILGRLRQKP